MHGVQHGWETRSERKGIRRTVGDREQILEDSRSHFKRFNFKKNKKLKKVWKRGMASLSKVIS